MPLNKATIDSLEGQYGRVALSVVLCNGLMPVGGDEGGNPAFYQHNDASSVVVFNPASDRQDEGKSKELDTIASTIQRAIKSNANLTGKQLVFPIAEEMDRKHWVTLHYNPETQKATLIDSFSSPVLAAEYNTSQMHGSLVDGLRQLNLEVISFEVKYQGAQVWHDATHCGAWTAYNVMALACGKTFKQHLQEVIPDVGSLVAKNKALAEELKHETANYLSWAVDDSHLSEELDDCEWFDDEPLDHNESGITKGTTTRRRMMQKSHPSDSTLGNTTGEDLSDDDELNLTSDHERVDEVDRAFCQRKQQTWLNETTLDFRLYLNDERSQLDTIIARKGICYNGRKLADFLDSSTNKIVFPNGEEFDFDGMLAQLQQRYQNTKTSQEAAKYDTGYTFAGHGHPYPNLIELGLAEGRVSDISVRQAIILEAISFTLQFKAEPIKLLSSFMSDPELGYVDEAREALFAKANELSRKFQVTLKTHIGQLVENYLQPSAYVHGDLLAILEGSCENLPSFREEEIIESAPQGGTFTITLLGTGTKYQPYKEADHNGPKRGDTLSHSHSLMAGVGRQFYYLSNEGKKTEHKVWLNELGQRVDEKPEGKLTHCLLEGPTDTGTEVYLRIAKAVMASLNAMMRGDDTINLTGHSRGAVEAILVAHELGRIQQAIQTAAQSLTYEEILTLIVNSNGPSNGWASYGAEASLISLKKDFQNEGFDVTAEDETSKANLAKTFSNRMQQLKVNIFALDPVPGGSWQGIDFAKWEDPRFYKLSNIVNEYHQWFMSNERSRCFEAIIPEKHDGITVYDIVAMFGHHSTPAGTAHGQDKTHLKGIAKACGKQHLLDANNQLKPGVTTADVQELFVYALHDFASRFGVTFVDSRTEAEGQKFDSDLDALLFSYNNMNKEQRESKKLDCYNVINGNREVYEMFNQWCYGTGQPGDKTRFAGWLVGGKRQRGDLPRQVRLSANVMGERAPHFSELSTQFVNEQHVELYLAQHFSQGSALSAYIHRTLNEDEANAQFKLLLTPRSNTASPVSSSAYVTEGVVLTSEDQCVALLKQAMVSRLFSTLEAFIRNGSDSPAYVELGAILQSLPFEQPQQPGKDANDEVIKFYLELRELFRERMAAFFDERIKDIKQKVEVCVLSLASVERLVDADNQALFLRYCQVRAELETWLKNTIALQELLALGPVSLEGKFALDDFQLQLERSMFQLCSGYEHLLLHKHAQLPELSTVERDFDKQVLNELLEQFAQRQNNDHDIQHQESIENVRAQLTEVHQQELQEQQRMHLRPQDRLRELTIEMDMDSQAENFYSQKVNIDEGLRVAKNTIQCLQADLEAQHRVALTNAGRETQESRQAAITELNAAHELALANARRESQESRQAAITELNEAHELALANARQESQESQQKAISELEAQHRVALTNVRQEEQESRQVAITELNAAHELALANAGREAQESQQKAISELEAQHRVVLANAGREAQESQQKAISELEAQHRVALTNAHREAQESQQKALAELEIQHGIALANAGREAQESQQKAISELEPQHRIALANAGREAQESRETQTQTQTQTQTPTQLVESSQIFEGISLQVLGAFIEVIGIALVSLAVAALAFGSLSASIPVCAAIAGGALLASAGFFAYDKGCELKQPHLEENIATPPSL